VLFSFANAKDRSHLNGLLSVDFTGILTFLKKTMVAIQKEAGTSLFLVAPLPAKADIQKARATRYAIKSD